MTTLKERIISLLERDPGLTDREITDRLFDRVTGPQAVNQATRALNAAGRVDRRTKSDGQIGNYPVDSADRPIEAPPRPIIHTRAPSVTKTSNVFDREVHLRSRLNAFMANRFGLPDDDYYSRLDQQALAELKSVLSDINNIFTLKVCLRFADWLAETLHLSANVLSDLKSVILQTPPNANGYDVEISDPLALIAEVKCNVPINRGEVFGSAQRDGIAKDINSLIGGKSKSRMKPEACLKFMVLLDTPATRSAMTQFVGSTRQYKDVVVFAESGIAPARKDRVYVVYISCAA